MSEFEYSDTDGIQSYSLPSAVAPNAHRHLVDRVDNEAWTIWPVDLFQALSLEDAKTYALELAKLIELAEKLNRHDLHRRTEPGQPAFEEVV